MLPETRRMAFILLIGGFRMNQKGKVEIKSNTSK
jgi:hypothetical protein